MRLKEIFLWCHIFLCNISVLITQTKLLWLVNNLQKKSFKVLSGALHRLSWKWISSYILEYLTWTFIKKIKKFLFTEIYILNDKKYWGCNRYLKYLRELRDKTQNLRYLATVAVNDTWSGQTMLIIQNYISVPTFIWVSTCSISGLLYWVFVVVKNLEKPGYNRIYI